jgi:hypothetical protein
LSTTGAARTQPQPSSVGAGRSTTRPSTREKGAEAWEREQLVDRLRRLRRVLPVLAQEMAAARRQVAHLRLDNRRLSDEVRELRAQLQAHEPRARSH